MKVCKHCDCELTGEVVVMHGDLFCSEECAIDNLVDEIIRGARQTAKEDYNEHAEIVNLEDIV